MSALGGNGSAGATNQGTLFITLADPAKRPSASVVVPEITRRLSGIPGLAVYLQNPPAIRIGGRTSKALYQYTLRGSDINELYASAASWSAALQKLKTVTDVPPTCSTPTRPCSCRSIASAPARWGSRRCRSSIRSPRRTTSSRRRRSTPRPTSTGSCWRCSPAPSATCRISRSCTSTRPVAT